MNRHLLEDAIDEVVGAAIVEAMSRYQAPGLRLCTSGFHIRTHPRLFHKLFPNSKFLNVYLGDKDDIASMEIDTFCLLDPDNEMCLSVSGKIMEEQPEKILRSEILPFLNLDFKKEYFNGLYEE